MPVRFLVDESFNGNVLDGLLLRDPTLDLVRVQDVGLAGQEDPVLLEWGSNNDRVLLTHDVRTIPRDTYRRLSAGLRVAGVCVIPQSLPIGRAIEEFLTIVHCSHDDEWEGQVRFLPL